MTNETTSATPPIDASPRRRATDFSDALAEQAANSARYCWILAHLDDDDESALDLLMGAAPEEWSGIIDAAIRSERDTTTGTL